MDKFELSMDTNSVHHWGIPEAVREYVQNSLDNNNDRVWDYNPETKTLTLTNRDTSLPRSIFLHGNSSKQGDPNSRGQYGDGIKSALAVLLREDVKVTFFNAGIIWQPEVIYSETFNSDVISISEYEDDFESSDFTVRLEGITQHTFDTILENTLPFQDDLGDFIETLSGKILKDTRFKGRIYCGGIFVCNFKTDYGFDFNPDRLPLDRDRKAVDPVQLRWQTKDMWAEVAAGSDESGAVELVNSMDSGESTLDFLSSAYSPANKNLENAAENIYKEKYSGTLVTSSSVELHSLQKAGNKVSLVKNDKLVQIIRQTDTYKSVQLGAKKVRTVEDLLTDYKDKWGLDMSIEMLNDFEDMESNILNN